MLSNARTVAIRLTGTGLWTIAYRTTLQDNFKDNDGGFYSPLDIETEAEYRVLEEFPKLESLLGRATVFRAKDRYAEWERVWVQVYEGRWGAVTLGARGAPYPVSTYPSQTVLEIIDLNTVVPLT